MTGHKLAQIGLPLRLPTSGTISRLRLYQPACSVMIVLRFALVYDGLSLLTGYPKGPVGMAGDRYFHHLLDQGIAGAVLDGAHGILDQAFMQEHLDGTLREI